MRGQIDQMGARADQLQAAFDSREIDNVIDLLDDQVTWRGIPTAGPHEHAHEEGAFDHEHDVPLCVNRDEVRAVFEDVLAAGMVGEPVVVAEVGDSVIVDPQVGPPAQPGLHQVFTYRGARVVLIQDFPHRTAALDGIRT